MALLACAAARLARRGPQFALIMAALAAVPGCVDIVSADLATYVDRDEKHFTVSGKPDVRLSTFDGSIEIRSWDRSEVQVVIERHAASRESAASIDVHAEQNGNQIVIDVRKPDASRLGFHLRSGFARLIVSLPAASDVVARSGDGAIDAEQISGRVELSSGDGSIRGRELDGDVNAHSGDGAIRLDGVRGALHVQTGDGSISAAGRLTSVHARSGDGRVTIHAEPGSTTDADWDVTTGDGSVILELPDGFSGELDAHTGDGRVRLQDLSLSNVVGELGKDTARGRLGAGGHTVRVRTGDGSIVLKRR